MNATFNPRTGEDWHREQIKAAVRMRGLCLSQLSEDAGYEPSSIYRALVRPWPAMERVIANALGCQPQDIWPSRYDRAGNPLVSREAKRTGRRRPSHRQNRGAA
ncbi:helix-turn-helix transcriptional regulator [Azorhizobium caulinodans]|uniref:helix-turn-helix domain-containing protein n=1 Tax=Azorhizobium caulinodans TaxID=7 RepID=UPI002FBDC696